MIKTFSNKNKEDKYGDDEIFESWADLNIFAPIAKKMVVPLYNLGMTPNMVTITSTIFTLSSIYFLHIENKQLAVFSYIFGYLLDCVDGRMARKYNLGSDIGMALDCVSDNISNLVLFIYILSTRPYNQQTIIFICILFFMSSMLSLSYGLNEAISAYESAQELSEEELSEEELSEEELSEEIDIEEELSEEELSEEELSEEIDIEEELSEEELSEEIDIEDFSDNFYKRRVNQLKDNKINTCYEQYLYSIFLLINKLSYTSYRIYFPKYDKQKIYEKLKILKHFGPGNYCIIVSIMLLYI